MRLAWVLFNVVLWTTVCGLSVILVGLVEWRGRAIREIARIWAKLILLTAGVPYRLIGADRLDRNRHYVFAGNHESEFDIPLCFAAIPQHIVALAKIELRKIPVLGWAMLMAGHIFVDRKNHQRALAALEKTRKSLVRNPRSILIYPEGTRSLDGEIHQFKKGGIVLALSLGMPIVPMAMCGTGEVIRKDSWKIHPCLVELRLGEPIETAGLNYEDREELTRRVRTSVLDLKAEWRAEQAATR